MYTIFYYDYVQIISIVIKSKVKKISMVYLQTLPFYPLKCQNQYHITNNENIMNILKKNISDNKIINTSEQ